MDGLDKLPRGGARVAQLAPTQRALAARQQRRQLDEGPSSHRLAQVSHASIAAKVAAPHPVRARTGADGDFVEDVAIADFAGALLSSESLGRR